MNYELFAFKFHLKKVKLRTSKLSGQAICQWRSLKFGLVGAVGQFRVRSFIVIKFL